MAAPDTPYDVFISYSHADDTWVWEWLRPRLEAAGLRVCLDRRDFDIGVASLVNMERAVDRSRHTLLVLTPAWVASEWTDFEALLTQTADPAARHRRLIPLLLQPCQPPRRIALLTYGNFTRREAWDAELQRLIAAIQGELNLSDLGPQLNQQPPQSREQRNRQAMLEKVRTYWIAGILQHSLVHEVLITLDMAERPEAVLRPLDLLVQRPDHGERPLPPGTRLIDVFDEVDRALLILGAPGAGKTTLLLELAKDLLGRAAQDPDAPMPVIFPLSSWTQQRRALTDWLVDALHDQYDIPRTLGHAWVASSQILPLLDGLDEVASAHRAACVEAINTFRQDHGLLPLIVCSRFDDYKALGTRLRLQGAIVVRPLTHEQVETYLAQIGPPVAAVHKALQDDSTLWELLDTPLMLFVMTLTYAGQPVVALRTSGTLQERRRDLFEHYVDRMFQRRSASRPYPRPQTERWLTWLAWQMEQHGLTVFHLERMQPDWLPPHPRVMLATGMGLLAGLVFELFFGLGGGLVTGLLAGLGGGLLAGLTTYSAALRTVEILHWSWSGVRSQWPVVLGIGPVGGLGFGLLFGLGGGLVTGLSPREIQTKTIPNEGIHRSARHALRLGLGLGLLFGLLFGLGFGLGFGLLFGLLFGGQPCLQHFGLRLFLVRRGWAPWPYVKFLNYAAEILFLRQVGGGYMFIHRLLQEYFAARHPESSHGVHPEIAQ
jgi:hypothetical protein